MKCICRNLFPFPFQVCNREYLPAQAERATGSLLVSGLSVFKVSGSIYNMKCCPLPPQFDVLAKHCWSTRRRNVVTTWPQLPLPLLLCGCSVAQLCPTLRDPTDCSTPGSLSSTVAQSLLTFTSSYFYRKVLFGEFCMLCDLMRIFFFLKQEWFQYDWLHMNSHMIESKVSQIWRSWHSGPDNPLLWGAVRCVVEGGLEASVASAS